MICSWSWGCSDFSVIHPSPTHTNTYISHTIHCRLLQGHYPDSNKIDNVLVDQKSIYKAHISGPSPRKSVLTNFSRDRWKCAKAEISGLLHNTMPINKTCILLALPANYSYCSQILQDLDTHRQHLCSNLSTTSVYVVRAICELLPACLYLSDTQIIL